MELGKIVCDGCGGNSFTKIGNHYECEYCGSTYIPKNSETVGEKTLDRIMAIEDLVTIGGRGTFVVGVIENGTVSINEAVIINNRTFRVVELEQFRKLIKTASAGMEVAILLRGATRDDFRVGDFIYKEEQECSEPAHNPATSEGDERELPDLDYQDRRSTGIRTSPKSGGCYIATAVYGSYDCPEVWSLRRYRDNILAKTWYGRAFIKMYYAISPIFVKWFGDAAWFKKVWRCKLDRIVANLREKGIESTPYEDRDW